ncbi:hypothetical protein C8R43DRAFT_1143451 [Mycena crocata]|nr:hypothetical protein C8R43DRAFT_1143451 [Mycena crocata]
MESRRPSRTPRPPLTAQQALVPLIFRAGNPEFPPVAPPEETPTTMDMPYTTGEAGLRHTESPFPNQGRQYLPSLASANQHFFKDSLARLIEQSGKTFAPTIRPTAPSASTMPPVIIDLASDLETGTTPTIIPAPVATTATPADTLTLNGAPRRPALVYVNLKDMGGQDDGTTFAVVLQLPYNPFASQILTELWSKDRRVPEITGKWIPQRIRFAYSRALVPVRHREYDDPFNGYIELGTHDEIIGNFAVDGFSGVRDITVRSVLPGEPLNQLRDVYGLESTAKAFSIFIFHTHSVIINGNE